MEEILKSKRKILQYLNDHNYDFSSCFKYDDDNFVIGYIGGTGNNSKKYSIFTMFNAFNNTKNNAMIFRILFSPFLSPYYLSKGVCHNSGGIF